MKVEQLYTNCLSEAAYFIYDEKEAAVIDPLRDVTVYIEMAKEQGVTIKYIFETHFHADFVSGHLDLAAQTGAQIVYGAAAKTNFDCVKAVDGQVFSIGNITLTALSTPGHTLESTCYLLENENKTPHAIFTGDTLFVGDVGRPDLFSGNLGKEELAALLYDSLNNKLKPLPDDVIVYPAHGPGSSCGKNIGTETVSTIGIQKKTNYAFADLSKEEFIDVVTTGLNKPPAYFPFNAKINQQGYEALETVMGKALTALSIEQFKALAEQEDVIMLDTRPSTIFTEGFIPESISVGLDGRFAEWVGIIIPFNHKIILITEVGKEKETITRLSRVGYDQVLGYLNGGFENWVHAGEKIDLVIDIDTDELAMDYPHDKMLEIIDVRKMSEFEMGHIQGANNIPLESFVDPLNLAQIDTHHNLYIHCAGGYRSVIASSLLKRHGFHNLRNVLGGFSKIKNTKGLPLIGITNAN